MGEGSCQDLFSEEPIAGEDGQLKLHLKPCESRIFAYEKTVEGN